MVVKHLGLTAALISIGVIGLVGCNSSSSDGDETAAAAAPINRNFGEPASQQIRPGVAITASGYGTCTSNFLYAANEVDYYIGVAAHCFSNDSNNGVNPCESSSAPIGFSGITIENASRPGELAYSSWTAMQENGETAGSELCQFNDFALVRLHVDDIDNVHPAAIAYGGPRALFNGVASVGDTVYSYGRSSFHFGVQDLQEKEGLISEVLAGGLAYRVSFDNAGLPGDSGSAILHEDGRALAVLTTVGISLGPSTVGNGAVSLERALNYGKASGHIPASTQLLTWTAFSP